MSELIAVLKVMPTSPEVDLDALQKAVTTAIPDGIDLQKIDVQPIAFGLKALMVTVITEDDGTGRIDTLADEILPKVEDVESVQVTEAGRL